MTIPTPTSRNVEALHGFVTGNDVFDSATDQVTIVWCASGKRGPIIKNKLLRLAEAFSGGGFG